MSGDASVEAFGTLDGEVVHQVTLRAKGGMVAKVLTWGAVLRDLRVPLPGGGTQGVVLGFRDFAPYPVQSPYFGAVVGRYANRIAGGRFTLDGETYELDRNEADATLHGGSGGFSQRLWRIKAASSDALTLALTSPDGDQGFPGRVEATCRYALGPGPRLRIDLRAWTDRATPVNLTHHAYYNLDGGRDIGDHRLRVPAAHYTPTGPGKIPTGEVAPVDGTHFDFRQPRRLLGADGGYDHNLVLATHGEPGMRPVAELVSNRSGILMRMASTEPGLQVYDGALIVATAAGLEGRAYAPHAGLCLEPQVFPDSPNRPGFPSAILRPGEAYHHAMVLEFDVGEPGAGGSPDRA